MSLRDQLLKAGLVDKKKARAASQQEKHERRAQQAHREKKRQVEAQQVAERQAERERQLQERLEAKRAADAEREAADRRRLVNNLLRDYRIRHKTGGQRFWVKAPDGVQTRRIDLPEHLAWDLRRGKAAVAWAGAADDPDCVLIPAEIAERLFRNEPGRVLFFNRPPLELDEPSEALYDGDGEVTAPRRRPSWS